MSINSNEVIDTVTPTTGNLTVNGNLIVSGSVSSGSGTQGAQGATGSQGATGAGTQGTQGTTGAGTQGTQGTTGAGTQGSSGANGTQGTTGTQGTIGVTGSQGAQGTTGSTGSQGTTGSTGSQGAVGAGTQGRTGTQGTTGTNGTQGTTGTNGTNGTQGTTGIQGTTGTQGTTGAGTQGVQGIIGVQGTAGSVSGTAGNISGGASKTVVYQTATNTTAFVAAPTSNPQVFYYNGNIGWSNTVQMSTTIHTDALTANLNVANNRIFNGNTFTANSMTLSSPVYIGDDPSYRLISGFRAPDYPTIVTGPTFVANAVYNPFDLELSTINMMPTVTLIDSSDDSNATITGVTGALLIDLNGHSMTSGTGRYQMGIVNVGNSDTSGNLATIDTLQGIQLMARDDDGQGGLYDIKSNVQLNNVVGFNSILDFSSANVSIGNAYGYRFTPGGTQVTPGGDKYAFYSPHADWDIFCKGNITVGSSLQVNGNASIGTGSGQSLTLNGLTLVRFNPTAPSTSIGTAGDVPGDIANDGTYLYSCKAVFDGSTNIWTRVLLTPGTW